MSNEAEKINSEPHAPLIKTRETAPLQMLQSEVYPSPERTRIVSTMNADTKPRSEPTHRTTRFLNPFTRFTSFMTKPVKIFSKEVFTDARLAAALSVLCYAGGAVFPPLYFAAPAFAGFALGRMLLDGSHGQSHGGHGSRGPWLTAGLTAMLLGATFSSLIQNALLLSAAALYPPITGIIAASVIASALLRFKNKNKKH